MARALVLGATGHIGAHIVRALLAAGHTVRAAYRSERLHELVLADLPIESVRVDLETLDGLRGALEGCAWVFHAAGYYPRFGERREQAIAAGIASTRRVLRAIRDARPERVVFTSSAATIQRVPGRPASEADAEPWPLPSWRPLYATVKIAMEHDVRRAADDGLPVVIVNPSVCIGEYDAHRFSGRILLVFVTRRLPVDFECRLNVVYTGDVGVGHVRAAARGRLGERYLLTCRNMTLHELAVLATQAAGLPPPRWRLPYRLALAAAIGSELVARVTRTEPLLPREAVRSTRLGQRLDGSRALRELDLPQTPIEDAVRRAIEWFKTHDE